MLIVLQSREKARLAQPIDLNQSDIRKHGPRAMNDFGWDGRASVSKLLQASEVIARQLGELRQQVDHCRHEHGMSRSLALHRLAECLGAELRNRDLTGTTDRCGKHKREVGDVKQ